MTLYFTRDVPNVPIFTLKLCPETFLRGILCTIQKNCPFTFVMMLIFSRCTVSSYDYTILYITHSFRTIDQHAEPNIGKIVKTNIILITKYLIVKSFIFYPKND